MSLSAVAIALVLENECMIMFRLLTVKSFLSHPKGQLVEGVVPYRLQIRTSLNLIGSITRLIVQSFELKDSVSETLLEARSPSSH